MDEIGFNWVEPSAFMARATVYTLGGFLNNLKPLHTARVVWSELKIMPLDNIPKRLTFTETVDFQGSMVLKMLTYPLYDPSCLEEYSCYVLEVIQAVIGLFGELE